DQPSLPAPLGLGLPRNIRLHLRLWDVGTLRHPPTRRYHGAITFFANAQKNMNRSIIDQYEAGPDKLIKAIAGMTPSDMAAAPIPNKWSTHQVNLHFAHAQPAFTDPIRRI